MGFLRNQGRMNKAFEAKVSELVSVTRHLDVAQILTLRRMTLADPESLKWANEKQLNVVFDVVLSKVLECMGKERAFLARASGYSPLLPPGFEGLEENRAVLSRIIEPMLAGYHPPREEEEEVGLTTVDAAKAADFSTLFDDTICAHVRSALKPLGARGSRHDILTPFVITPKFGPCYEKVLREFVLPTMRASKKIKALGKRYDWAKAGPNKIIEIIQGRDDANNPILHQWDMRWESFIRERAGSKVVALKDEDDPWPLFRAHAEKHGYAPPNEGDVQVLKDVIRWKSDDIIQGWSEINQLFEQEFKPKSKWDKARPGAFRDGIIKWIDRLPLHTGDLLAIRCHFDFAKVDRLFLRTLIQTLGGSDKERFRKAPVLLQFYNDLPR